MTKYEFLGDLSRLIADLPQEDRDQAMEYYEDYFADAGPDKEKELLQEFVSPEFIAQQIKESSAQRLAAQTPGANQHVSAISEATEHPEASAIPWTSIATGAAATPEESAPSTAAVPEAPAAPSKPTQIKDPILSERDIEAMRNPIFQQQDDDAIKAELKAQQDAKRKTQVNIKSLDKAVSEASKQNAKQRKGDSSESDYASPLYGGQKSGLASSLLILTIPAFLAALILLAVLAIGVILAAAATFLGSIGCFLLALLCLFTLQMPNVMFTFGISLLLFVGLLLCILLDRYLITRALPGTYYSMVTRFKNIQAKLKR